MAQLQAGTIGPEISITTGVSEHQTMPHLKDKKQALRRERIGAAATSTGWT